MGCTLPGKPVLELVADVHFTFIKANLFNSVLIYKRLMLQPHVETILNFSNYLNHTAASYPFI